MEGGEVGVCIVFPMMLVQAQGEHSLRHCAGVTVYVLSRGKEQAEEIDPVNNLHSKLLLWTRPLFP